MNKSGLLAVVALVGIVLVTVLAGARADLGTAAARPSDGVAQRTGDPPVLAAAYSAIGAMETATAFELPLWRHAHTPAEMTTAIAVMNTNLRDVDATITFRDGSGAPITGCTADCSATIAPDETHYFWPPDMKGLTELPGTAGTATVTASGPIAVAVLDLSTADALDSAAYHGIGRGAEFPSGSVQTVPILYKDWPLTARSGFGDGRSSMRVLNLAQQARATMAVDFYQQGGTGRPITVLGSTTPPGQYAVFDLPNLAELPDGAYSAIVTSDQSIAVSARTEWPSVAGAAMVRESLASTETIVPFVFKDDNRRCSIVSIQNTDTNAEVDIEAELFELGATKPAVTQPYVIAPGESVSLDICGDDDWAVIPEAFRGAMRVRAPNQGALAAHAATYVVDGRAVAGLAGLPTFLAVDRMDVPLVHSLITLDRGNPNLPVMNTRIAVSNPGRTPVEVKATFHGFLGTCAGQTFDADPQTLPEFATILIDPSPIGLKLLPERCMASAVIESSGGDILAAVLDEGYLQEPTATPTRPTLTPTPTSTNRPTLTSTPTHTLPPTREATATNTDQPTRPPTDTATPISPTPVSPTPPRTTPRPAATAVPPSGWTRVDHANSLLPYDQVRYLEIGRDGSTWMRVINPRGGPDTIVRVTRDGKWKTYTAGIKAVVEREPRELLLQLRALRDFFDVDARDRIWVGPEVHAGDAWEAGASDDPSPGGGLAYEDRTLVDRAQQAWVPFSTQLDCPPPSRCAADGLRAFGPGLGPVAEIEVRSAGRPPGGYGVPDVMLLSRRGSGPGTVLAGGSAADPDGPAQDPDAAQWVVTPSEVFSLPGAESAYYPMLDPREFLVTGLRNAGFASASALTPDGDLQVVTWVERDTGTTVAYHVMLNTLGEGGWQTEDLTGTPLLGDDVEFEYVVAMDYCPGGELWLATSVGTIGVRRDGERPDGEWTVYAPDYGVLEPGERVSDIGCGPDGAVWVGTQEGLTGYGFEKPPVVVFAPVVEK